MGKRTEKTEVNAREWYEKGCELKRAGNLKEAVSDFAKAIDCDTRFAEAYFIRGACYYLLGQYQLAMIDMDAAALLGCKEAQLWSRFDTRCFVDSDEDLDS